MFPWWCPFFYCTIFSDDCEKNKENHLTLDSCSPNWSSFCWSGVRSASVEAISSLIFPISVCTPVATTTPVALPAAMLVPWWDAIAGRKSASAQINKLSGLNKRAPHSCCWGIFHPLPTHTFSSASYTSTCCSHLLLISNHVSILAVIINSLPGCLWINARRSCRLSQDWSPDFSLWPPLSRKPRLCLDASSFGTWIFVISLG